MLFAIRISKPGVRWHWELYYYDALIKEGSTFSESRAIAKAMKARDRVAKSVNPPNRLVARV